MARQRFIWPDLWTDPKIGRLEPAEMLFYIGLFSNADDEGRILADPAYLRSTIFPYQPLGDDDVRALRDAVASKIPAVLLYKVKKSDFITLRNWDKFQRPKYPKPSKLPPPRGRKPAGTKAKDAPPIPPSLPQASPNDGGTLEESFPPREGVREGLGSSSEGRAVVSYAGNGLPKNYKEELILKLLNAIGADADEGTLPVVSSYAKKLPEAGIAKVLESVARSRARNRAEYAVKALVSECAERGIS